MKEHNLDKILELHTLTKVIEDHLSEAVNRADDLSICYMIQPTELTNKQGEQVMVNHLDVYAVLSISSDILKARVNSVIQDMLQEKIDIYRAQLKRLGVKLEGDPPKTKEPLRLPHLKQVK